MREINLAERLMHGVVVTASDVDGLFTNRNKMRAARFAMQARARKAEGGEGGIVRESIIASVTSRS